MKSNKPCMAGVLSAVALALLFTSGNALAYLDPSTGSMVISAIVGIIASSALAVKTFWYRIKRRIRRADKPASPAEKAAPGKD